MTMPPADFRSLVVRRRDSCVKFTSDKPSKDRREAMRFYKGDNLSLYGDSGDGLSTVVSRDVMEAIESVMPPLLRPFVAGEEVVSFDPVEDGDEESAKQSSDYVNHIFRRHNNVLDVVQTALKDGLLFRLGIAKTVVEEEDGPPEPYSGLDEFQLEALQMQAAAEGREIAGDIEQDPETGLFTATLAPKKVKKFHVHVIAPDEFLYEERLTSLQAASFLGHRKQVSLGDLIDMGIDEKLAIGVNSGKPSEENDERFDNETDEPSELAANDHARMIWVDECYIKCNYAGNGLEWRKVLLGGSETTILSNEPADDHPYSSWTPIPIPHKLAGLSYYDLTRDIQMQKTALQREMLNNLYLVNRPQREVVESQVNIDDLLSPAIDGIVRVKALNSIRQLTTPFVAGESFSMIEYQDGVREARTGVTRYNQGMDANSLNKTATGMNIISNNSQQRQELVARQFGEFLKDIFEKLLALATRHASEADVTKLRGHFVPWPTEYDTTVSVGLGTNNKDQLVGHLMGLAQMHERIIGLQQGIQGPVVTAENVFEVLKRIPEAMGLKGANYFTDPKDAAQQQPQQEEQPDPLAEAKIKSQTEIEKAKIGAATDLQVAEIKQQPAPFELVEGGLA